MRVTPLAGLAMAALALGAPALGRQTPSAPAPTPTANASSVARPANWPAITSPVPEDPVLEKKITRLIARMSLEQKVGQIVQGDIASITPDDVRKYHLGSVFNGGNSDPGGKYNAPAKDWLALTGFDPVFGARPLRRLVQSAIGDKLAKALLTGAIMDGDEVLVDLDTNADELTVKAGANAKV